VLRFMTFVIMVCGGVLAAWAAPSRPTIEVRSSHTVISQTCRVVIPAGTVLDDTESLGAIQIGAANIEIEFVKGSVLRGSHAGNGTGPIPRLRHPPQRTRGYHDPWSAHQRVLLRPVGDEGRWSDA